MPNLCNNRLVINGEKKDIRAFKKRARGEGTVLSFNSFVPMPEELDQISTGYRTIDGKLYELWRGPEAEPVGLEKKEIAQLVKKYGASNWYDWRLDNWGTKWDAGYAKLRDKSENHLDYRFDTAWSPPLEWQKRVAAHYRQLRLSMTYDEGGTGLLGRATAENGKVKDQRITTAA